VLTIDLGGRTAIVTGAGRGIGREIASKLAQAGASVVINDLDASVLKEAADELAKEGRITSLAGDMTTPDFPQQLVETALQAYGRIDIVVNNAGYTWDNVIQKTTDEQFQAMLDIHLTAPFRLLRAASGYIREAAKAEIASGSRVMRKVVNITSIAGTDGNAGQSGYSSGKAGVIGLTKTMAKEWGRYNVTVNAVGFGLIQTRLIQPIARESATIEIKGRSIAVGVQPKVLETVANACPLGRLGTPDEAANTVLFFCCPMSDYITGEVLICGGGLHF
jgi:3-oxoacyl-[acyl-carrier protein] reductase